MGVTVAIVRAAATVAGAPYTQDFSTADLGGLTPKAAMFIVTSATADDTATAHRWTSFGATDGTRQWSLTETDENGQGTTDTHSQIQTDEVIRINTPGTATLVGEAEFSAFGADKVTVNWTNAPDAAYLVTVVLFAGTDLTAYANTEALGDALDNAVDVTNPGFEPDLVFAVCENGLSADGGNSTIIRGSYGVVHNNGGVTQRSIATYSRNAQAAGDPASYYSEAYGLSVLSSTGAALDWGGEFGTFDANGFTVTTRIAGANSTLMLYLALNFGGVVSAGVGTMNTPVGNGNDAQAGPGFTPQFVMLGLTHLEAVATVAQDATGGVFGLSTFDADDEFSNTVATEDAAGTTVTQSISSSDAVYLEQDDGTAGHRATFVSFDANGWTLNFSATLGNAKKWWWAAIGEAAAGIAQSILSRGEGTNTNITGGLIVR